jgi:hypothetical protein
LVHGLREILKQDGLPEFQSDQISGHMIIRCNDW